MSLVAIIGPMKSGKSLELLARIAPHTFTDRRILLVQPHINVRDRGITSRIGLKEKATKVKSLTEVTGTFDIIGIDEVHMFNPEDVSVIARWLAEDKEVYVSGLDVGYDGLMMPTMKRILELKPDTIIDKISVCEICKEYRGRFTKISHKGVVMRSGLPSIMPENGTYVYETNCRQCFLQD